MTTRAALLPKELFAIEQEWLREYQFSCYYLMHQLYNTIYISQIWGIILLQYDDDDDDVVEDNKKQLANSFFIPNKENIWRFGLD